MDLGCHTTASHGPHCQRVSAPLYISSGTVFQPWKNEGAGAPVAQAVAWQHNQRGSSLKVTLMITLLVSGV